MGSSGEAKSWGDLIRHEERRRKEVPWTGAKVDPVRFVTRYEVSRKEVEFNPILQRYADADREQMLQRRESEGRVQQLNKAKVKQLRNESLQDALTHTSKIPGSESHSSFFRESSVAPKSGYNIISNMDLSEHHYDRPENRPSPLKESKERFKVLIKPREFNIITNRYEQEHDKKIETDQDRNRNFYRQKKEERFKEKLERKEASHGADHLSRLPASLRVSEGNFCNIVTKEVKDPDMLRRWEKEHVTKKAGKAVATVERTQRQRAVQMQQLQSVRKKNRSLRKYRAEERLSDRDFNIVNNKSYIGRKGITKWRAEKTANPASLWGSIEADWKVVGPRKSATQASQTLGSNNETEKHEEQRASS